NTATFIGQKFAGIMGGIAATLGVVFPSIVIISIIAAFITNFAELAVVQNALAGVRVCVCVLIFNAVLKLFKSSVKDAFTMAVFAIVLALMLIFNASPVIFIVLAAIAGIVYKVLLGGKKA
ncbi:MAG: chromate transporter, partial [Oscillospiraceae bacterium]|nr:chromate transporter [Oscillospiraceae bacterium]